MTAERGYNPDLPQTEVGKDDASRFYKSGVDFTPADLDQGILNLAYERKKPDGKRDDYRNGYAPSRLALLMEKGDPRYSDLKIEAVLADLEKTAQFNLAKRGIAGSYDDVFMAQLAMKMHDPAAFQRHREAKIAEDTKKGEHGMKAYGIYKLEELRKAQDWENFAHLAPAMKEYFQDEIAVTDEDFQQMKGTYEKLRNEGNWGMLELVALAIKFLFPDKFKELGFSEDDWDSLKVMQQEFKGKQDLSHLDASARMKLLGSQVNNASETLEVMSQ
jgi:hypothetical protein